MTDEPQKPETTLTVDPQAEKSSTQPDTDAQVPASVSSAASSTPSSGTSLGGRVRKTTQMFTFVQAKSDETEEFSPPVGKGIKVRDMEFVRNNVEALGKKQHDMIKQLYSIMFGRRFQQKNVKVIKEHILGFSGIVEQDEKSREQQVAKMGKWKLIFVHEVMDLLAVDRSKKSCDEEGKPHTKETLLERLIDWLYNPQETKLGEKKATIAAKKAKQKANKQARKAKAARKSESEPAKKKQKTTKKKSVAIEEEDEDDHEATESEGEESSSDFEEAKKKPSKKRKATRRPKKARVVESDNEDDEGDEVEKEKNSSAETDEVQPAAEPEEESNVADKEEPKPETETLGADVCSKVRDIIAQGDAEELTVKKIVRQLSADLGRDMSAQKKAIKEFITNDQVGV